MSFSIVRIYKKMYACSHFKINWPAHYRILLYYYHYVVDCLGSYRHKSKGNCFITWRLWVVTIHVDWRIVVIGGPKVMSRPAGTTICDAGVCIARLLLSSLVVRKTCRHVRSEAHLIMSHRQTGPTNRSEEPSVHEFNIRVSCYSENLMETDAINKKLFKMQGCGEVSEKHFHGAVTVKIPHWWPSTCDVSRFATLHEITKILQNHGRFSYLPVFLCVFIIWWRSTKHLSF